LRYITSDPIGLDANTLNTYAYANSNPIMYFDPNGLDAALVPEDSNPRSGPIESPSFPGHPICTVAACRPDQYFYVSDFSGDKACIADCIKEANRTISLFSPIPFFEDSSPMRSLAAWAIGRKELFSCVKDCECQ